MSPEMNIDYDALLAEAFGPVPHDPDYAKGLSVVEWSRVLGRSTEHTRRKIKATPDRWVQATDWRKSGTRFRPVDVWRLKAGWDKGLVKELVEKLNG